MEETPKKQLKKPFKKTNNTKYQPWCFMKKICLNTTCKRWHEPIRDEYQKCIIDHKHIDKTLCPYWHQPCKEYIFLSQLYFKFPKDNPHQTEIYNALFMIEICTKKLSKKKEQLSKEAYSQGELEVVKARILERELIYQNFLKINVDKANLVLKNPKLCETMKQRILRERFRVNPFTLDEMGEKIYSDPLPAITKLYDIEKALTNNQVIIIPGQTGSGKSTQIPQYIADKFYSSKVLVTQPRKIAAVSLSERVNFEFDPNNLNTIPNVGYNVGGNRVDGNKIMFYTEQKLLSELINPIKRKKLLKNYCSIVVDEAHERNITTDLILGIVKSILIEQKENNVKYPLKLVITSATIDTNKFREYFSKDKLDCAIIEIEGRLFPIQHVFLPSITKESYITRAINCVLDHIESRRYLGDILVFLTGQEEVEYAINDTTERLENDDYSVFGLFGKQPIEEQKKVFKATTSKKIIFATNIAETSLTIDGVRCVIDTGVEKQAFFDHQRNMTVIRTTTISRNSAIQRAGRAGRTAPGICYHLYSEEEYNKFDIDNTPEILRASLGTTTLILKTMNINIQEFNWIDSPCRSDIDSTYKKLEYLQAIDEQGNITDLGKFVAKNQVDPCIGKLLFEGKQKNMKYIVLLLAGILSVSIWWYGGNKKQKLKCIEKKQNCIKSLVDQIGQPLSDVGDTIVDCFVFLHWVNIKAHNRHKWCVQNSINNGSLRLCYSMLFDYARMLDFKNFDSKILKKNLRNLPNDYNFSVDNLKKLLFSAYFQNLCYINPERNIYSYTCSIQGLKGVKHPSSIVFGEYQTIIYHNLLKTSRTWLIGNTPVDQNISDVLPPNLRRKFEAEQRSNIRIKEELSIQKVIIDKICGKHYCNIPALEKENKVILDVDKDSHTINIWAFERYLQSAVSNIKKLVTEYTVALENEVYEHNFVLTGTTRAIFGAGAEIQQVLLGDEYLKLFVTNLPPNITEEDLENHIKRELRTINEHFDKFKDTYQIEIFPFSSSSSRAIVFCKNANKAKIIRQQLDNSRINYSSSESIRCTTYGTHNTSSIQMDNIMFSYYWPLGYNSTRGVIIFQKREDANNAFKYQDSNASANSMKLVFPTGKHLLHEVNLEKTEYIKPIGSRDIKKGYGFSIINIPEHFTEQKLHNIYNKFGNIEFCVIFRNPPKTNEDFSFEITTLKSLPQFSNDTITTDILPDNSGKCLAGISAAIPISKGLEIIPKIITSKIRIYNQPPQAVLSVGYSISFHKDIYYTLKSHFTDYISRAKSFGVSTKLIEAKRNNQTLIQLSVLINSPNNSENNEIIKSLTSVRNIFANLLKPTMYQHSNILFLFTRKGSIFLSDFDKEAKKYEKAFIHWDKSNKSVKIYGDENQISEAKGKLDKFLNKFNDCITIQLYYKRKLKRDVYKIRPTIEKREDILKVDLDRKKCCIILQSDALNIDKLKRNIKKIGCNANIYFYDEQLDCNISINSENDTCCPICFDNDEEDFSVCLQACGHRYHLECFQGKMKNDMNFPIQCDFVDCGKKLIWKDITAYVEETQLEKILNSSKRSFFAKHTEKYINCFGVDCEQYFKTSERQFNCEHCCLSYCAKCCIKKKEPIPIHPGATCDLLTNETENWLKLGVTPCPKCSVGIMKNGGCKHMTCENCKTHFCWNCLAIKKPGGFGCTCNRGINCSQIYHHMNYCNELIRK